MEFQVFLPQMRFELPAMVDRARAAEAGGFHGMALMDHLAPPLAESQPMYEAMLASTWLAAHTDTLCLGHLVLCDSMRHPAMLAKEAVTLDHASGGRFELGIGWGSVPAELEVFGVGDTSASSRVDRLRESLEVIKALWTGEPVDFEGSHHQLRGAQQQPTPLGHIPIVIGGVGPKTLKLVARHADWWNVPVHQLDKLDALRDGAGDARVSVQQLVAWVPDEASRAEITAVATRRFAVYGDGLVIGTGAELAEHFSALRTRGVERVYTWFADFAQPDTLAAFGSEVIASMEAGSTT